MEATSSSNVVASTFSLSEVDFVNSEEFLQAKRALSSTTLFMFIEERNTTAQII
jgi:hypothetical protein